MGAAQHKTAAIGDRLHAGAELATGQKLAAVAASAAALAGGGTALDEFANHDRAARAAQVAQEQPPEPPADRLEDPSVPVPTAPPDVTVTEPPSEPPTEPPPPTEPAGAATTVTRERVRPDGSFRPDERAGLRRGGPAGEPRRGSGREEHGWSGREWRQRRKRRRIRALTSGMLAYP